MLHLSLEVSRLDDPRIDNHNTLKQVKELDHLTNGLTIPSITQKNAANRVDVSAIIPSRRTRRSLRRNFN